MRFAPSMGRGWILALPFAVTPPVVDFLPMQHPHFQRPANLNRQSPGQEFE